MLTIDKKRSKAKNKIVLNHEGRGWEDTLTLTVGENEKQFIQDNITNLRYDACRERFYIVNWKPSAKKPAVRTTLQRALWKEFSGSKKTPDRIQRPDQFDFTVANWG